MAAPADLDHYGYQCSMCQCMDTFNEQLLYSAPPSTISRQLSSLVDKHIHHLGGSYVMGLVTDINLTLPCCRKLKHLPTPCPTNPHESCERDYHWRLCPGFFRITMCVSFQLLFTNKPMCTVSTRIENVKIRNILPVGTPPNCDIRDWVEDIPVPTKADSKKNVIVKRRCSLIMDRLFQHNIAFMILDNLYFVANEQEKMHVVELSTIIGTFPALTREIQHSPLYQNLKGIMLLCGRDVQRQYDVEQKVTWVLPIPVKDILQTLQVCTRSRRPGLQLYFNSYHMCRGLFGVQSCQVVLVLVNEALEEEVQYCQQSMVTLPLKNNPFLQIDPRLGVIRYAQSLDTHQFRILVTLFLVGDLNVKATESNWKRL